MNLNHQSRSAGMVSSLTVALAILTVQQPPVESIQLADGKTYFAQIPRLIDAEATFDATRFPRSIYYFTLAIPEDAGEPLQRVTIQQQPGFDDVAFNLKRTVAYEQPKRKRVLPLRPVSRNATNTIVIDFEAPVQPGTTLTIGLRTHQNPRAGGTYLFGVTAFPAGEQGHGQFLGYGRIPIFDSGSNNS